MLPSKNDSAELVDRIRSGDRSAETELVERFERGIRILVRQRTGCSPESEDLCQETFRIALEKIRSGNLRDPQRLAGFICGIARNLASDHLRKPARRTVDLEEVGPLSDPKPDPADESLRRERVEMVRQVLQELRIDRDRMVLFRFYIAEEDKDSICASLGLSSQHFNRVLFRARERFRELYLERLRHCSSDRFRDKSAARSTSLI